MTIHTPSTPAATAAKILVAVSLLAGALSLLFSWLFWARFHVDIPVEDSLTLLPFVQAVVESGWSGVTFQEWIAPHSSAHRIAIGRLLMATEYKYLWGENYLSYLGSWLSIGALCYLYSGASRLSRPHGVDTGYFMLGMALIYCLSYTQVGNLISAVNALWYISAACCACSIYLFVAPGETLTPQRALAACLFAISASYATFLGVIGCLVLVLLAIQSRSRHAIWVCALLFLFVALYVTGIKPATSSAAPDKNAFASMVSTVTVLIEHRQTFFDFAVAFLGAPMSMSSPVLSYIYVIPSCLLVIYGWIVQARQWYRRETGGGAPEKFYLAMATVCLGTAMASAIGRAGFNAPTDPRYQTIVMLYWLSIGGLLLHQLPGKSLTWARAACMLLVLLMPLGLLYQLSNFDLLLEVRKSTTARNIELSTRLGSPLFRDSRRPSNAYTPRYLEHEAFLSRNSKLSANVPFAVEPVHDTPAACHAMSIDIRPLSRNSRRTGLVKLTVDGDRFQRFREVRIAGPDNGRGILYPAPAKPFTIAALLWEDTAWKGYYQGRLDASTFTLVFDAVLGPDFHCQLRHR